MILRNIQGEMRKCIDVCWSSNGLLAVDTKSIPDNMLTYDQKGVEPQDCNFSEVEVAIGSAIRSQGLVWVVLLCRGADVNLP